METKSKFEKTLNILEATNTNWKAEKLPLISECGKSTGSFGMFRSDNSEWLGTIKGRYTPYQNHTLVELLLDATEMLNLDVTNGGILKDGAKVFYQIELPDEFIGKSSIKRQITALNSHDGSSSIGFGSSNKVVVCQNTFFMAHRELEKVRHTESAHDRVYAMAMNLKDTISKDLLLMENFKRMADMPMTDEIVQRLVKSLFKVDVDKQLNDVSTRTKNTIEVFAGNLNTEIQLEGKTIWGLFNAVTRYTNHEASPRDAVKKNEFLMQGNGATLSNMAYNELLKWVTKNTADYVFIER